MQLARGFSRFAVEITRFFRPSHMLPQDKKTTPKLIPIVTTQETPTIDAVELAKTYIHRWPAQENILKDYLLPLGLDTNHGFAKVAVENSEVAKRRTHLEQRLTRLKRWAQSAGKREAQASRRRERLRKIFTSRSKELYQDLWTYQRTLEEQGVADHVLRREVKERKAVADAEPVFSAILCTSHLETSAAVFSAFWYDHARRYDGTGRTAPIQRPRAESRPGSSV